MKKVILFSVFLFLPLLIAGTLSAGIVGDINGDGKISLVEAIYALQVTSGIYPELPDSCILVGRGSWADSEDYNLCDVVEYSGSNYASILSHTSATVTNEPPNPTYWTLLTTTGPQGPAGVAGADGATGPQGPAGVAGADGAPGADGDTGPQGPAGVAGATGSQGEVGPTGPQGVQGPQGDIGPTGAQGEAGAAPFSLNGNDAYYNAGNVGIGTTSPDARLDVSGDVKLGSDGSNFQSIMVLTGTTASGVSSNLSYPAGWNMNNTYILSMKIFVNDYYWMPIVNGNYSFVLDPTAIYIYYPDSTAYNSKTYKLVVMRVD